MMRMLIPNHLCVGETVSYFVPKSSQKRKCKKNKRKVEGVMTDLTPAPEKTLPYKVPDWIGPPRYEFWFEIRNLEDEAIGRMDLYGQGAFEIGRWTLEPDSKHSDEEPLLVLVYEENGDAYVFDLGRSIATFLNNTEVKREVYVKINIGDTIHFEGCRAEAQAICTVTKMQIYEWIHNQLCIKSWVKSLGTSPLINHIKKILWWRHVQMVEVPFIAMYQKNQCLSLLNTDLEKEGLKWHKVLWAVQDLDLEWQALHKRKTDLNSKYLEMLKIESDSTRRQVLKSVMDLLNDAGSEMDDVEQKFELYFPVKGCETSITVEQYRNLWSKVDVFAIYNICDKAGLSKIACHFSNSFEEFGVQLSLEKEGTNKEEDPQSFTINFSVKSTSAIFKSYDAVIEGAKHMAAMKIFCDPFVRKTVRRLREKVEWSTEKEDFQNSDQWLGVEDAEEEPLVQVNIQVSDSTRIRIRDELKKYYVGGDLIRGWNSDEESILDKAATLLNGLWEKEARHQLDIEVKNYRRMEYGKHIWEKVIGNGIGEDDSLAKVASLCGQQKEILTWDVCPCQEYLCGGPTYG